MNLKISSSPTSFPGRKSMRQSTAEHTRQTFLRVQERQGQSRRRKGPHCERPLTQEELLREAKITEEFNLRSLGQSIVLRRVGRGAEEHKKNRPGGPEELERWKSGPRKSEERIGESKGLGARSWAVRRALKNKFMLK